MKELKLVNDVKSSYEAFHGRSLVVQLIPAVGIIAFAAWGLGPLLRVCRVFFLQKNDDNWNKSKEHRVMTSYIQPLLLWGGALLICSTEPVILPSASSQAAKQRLLNFVRSLSTVLAFAYCLSSLDHYLASFTQAARNNVLLAVPALLYAINNYLKLTMQVLVM
ncbi:hypothetical protein L1987_16586 [Smallanthus sonchifolius]|uniref:Uncharacterized protein n=1 Tax=Smallanthus sonchifolius TaxID=185202 RepID=A0ACB9IV63_9ASTR|nr:hypothetical protein L1987_16586 [Smallanthus sonchifolius]